MLSGRRRLDVIVPLLAVMSAVFLPMILGNAIRISLDVRHAKAVPAKIVGLSDRSPYAERRDTFRLEYPVVRYVDHQGFQRTLLPYTGTFPGYFYIGQEVNVGVVGNDYIILDHWYIWQENLVKIPFLGIFILYAIGYYLSWRPRMLAKELERDAAHRGA